MASGGDEKELGASFLASSEPVYDFICDLCGEEGKNLEAAGYCNDCNDYLCGDCFRNHRKSRLTKAHVLVGKEHMPHEKPSTGKYQIDDEIFTEKCKIHRGEYIKYYCKVHSELGCSVCITINHRECKGVQYIRDICDEAEESPEYQELMTQVDTLATVTQDVIHDARAGITTAESSNTARISKIRKFKEELSTSINRLETEAIKLSEEMARADVGNLKVVVDSCGDTLKSTQIIREELQSLNKAHQNCRLFVAMKEAMVKLDTLRHNCETSVERFKITYHTFHPNKELVTLLRAKEALGTFCPEKAEATMHLINMNISKNPSSFKAKIVTDINAKSADDLTKCYITSSVVMPCGKLVITDYHNSNVKLIDVNSFQLMSSINVRDIGYDPWDVTRVNDAVVAVTVPTLKQIHLIEVTNTMKTVRKIGVHGVCRGIDYNNGTFVVSYEDKQIEILDLQGQVVRTIHSNKLDLFSQPYFVKHDSRNKALYVSDYLIHKVTRLSLDGDVMSSYSGRSPHNMCLDTQGNIYICNNGNNEIMMLNPDCSMIKVILSQSHGLCFPMSVAFCVETNRLYVGGEVNSVKVYQLS